MQENITQQIENLKPELYSRFGIKKLALFGSYAKGEQTDKSDVDIVIIEMERKNGFLIAKAQRFLSEQLQKKVDIGLLSAMNPYVKKSIQQDMTYV
ncbi:nucleotidyltransferase domain-containing protein [Desulfurispirillum indicum]|uniref:nucleotidyltransferase family protein n=1 Tax=Desulfurispirillum indicum TaxID=936456 RepID=UPI001CFA79A0|nr:nucleotidyltransferase domain-containing protein [Desulfurispirillum indicum]UCZ56536.1 nucleotidyltransferase domain-containing protein [Desulfurispirillum indicum]